MKTSILLSVIPILANTAFAEPASRPGNHTHDSWQISLYYAPNCSTHNAYPSRPEPYGSTHRHIAKQRRSSTLETGGDISGGRRNFTAPFNRLGGDGDTTDCKPIPEFDGPFISASIEAHESCHIKFYDTSNCTAKSELWKKTHHEDHKKSHHDNRKCLSHDNVHTIAAYSVKCH